MSVLDLARADLRTLQPYSSARMEACGGAVLLNANESAWEPAGDNGVHCNRYPEPQPATLVAALADLYQVDRRQLLITRGSDDAIDLLARAFCNAGVDAVLIQPPTFGMYAVSAQIQGARVIEVPLTNDFRLDVDAVLAALVPAVKLVFVCAPNNPTGQGITRGELQRLAKALTGRAMLVVDEAYVEFADEPSMSGLLDRHDHLVVLRTLSKAWALAGARIGSVLAHREVIALLGRIMSPYPLGRPCVEAALRALSADGRERTRERIGVIRAERFRMATALRGLACVRSVLSSQANFLTVRFLDAGAVFHRLLGAGIVVRDVRHYPGLADSLRLTIGTPMENDFVLRTLGETGPCA